MYLFSQLNIYLVGMFISSFITIDEDCKNDFRDATSYIDYQILLYHYNETHQPLQTNLMNRSLRATKPLHLLQKWKQSYF